MELERNIKYVLEDWKKTRMCSSVWRDHNYLTNEKRDIGQEINTGHRLQQKEIEELKKILVSDVLGKMTVAYGDGVPRFPLWFAHRWCNSPRSSSSG